MGSASRFAKTIVIPATISLALYLLLSFIIAPFVRRYHQRYSQYLPLHRISAHTFSLRDRVADTVLRLVYRRQAHLDDHHDNTSIFDEEGEIMVGMDMDPARREALERRRSTTVDAPSRLSRDLEQGFMDDSDEDSDSQENSQLRQ